MTIPVSKRSLADIEMILIGAYDPLDGFLGRADYESVLAKCRLEDGKLWPVPITLPVTGEIKKTLKVGRQADLTSDGNVVATMDVEEIYPAQKDEEARQVYKTADKKHPGVAALEKQGDFYVGGKLTAVDLPEHEEFAPYNLSPQQTRREFEKRKWKTVVAFQTRNPIHRAHEQITKAALEPLDGLLIHPLVGEVKKDDIPAKARIASYEVLVKNHYPQGRVMMSIYPANMYYAGPREALLHALARKNYGCTHFIVGRDHAGVGNYYGSNDAMDFLKTFDVKELGITPVYFEKALNVSGSEIRALLAAGKRPPEDMMRTDVADVLIKALR